MDRSRIPSPAHSQGTPMTSRRHRARSTRSVGSPARSVGSGRLTSIIDDFKENNKMSSFVLSPLTKSVLNDNTDIVEPRRKSWWKKVENSMDIIEVLENSPPANENENVFEGLDLEIMSPEKKHYSMDIPESSGSESIQSILIPERKLFPQKQVQKTVYNQLVAAREALAKHNKTNVADKTHANAGTKSLFNHGPKRSKPVFPAALLVISPDKTLANKTKEIIADVRPPTRNLFGHGEPKKQKNIYADFVLSESEDEISDIQPKRFTFHKQPEPVRRPSSKGTREHSPTSSATTDIEMDDWKLLPSSTMVEHQLEALVTNTPGRRRTRLSNLSVVKETDATSTINKTKDSNKSSSKNKSKNKTLNQAKGKDSPTKNNTQNKSKVNLNKSKNPSPVKAAASNDTQDLKNKTRVLDKSAKNVSKNMNIEAQNHVEEIMVENVKEQQEQQVAMSDQQNNESDENFVLQYDDNAENTENVPKDKTRVIEIFEKRESLNHKSKMQEEAVTPHKNKTHNLTHKVIEESVEDSDNNQDSAQDEKESSKQVTENQEIEDNAFENEEEIDGALQEENESDNEENGGGDDIEVNEENEEEEEIQEEQEEEIEESEQENDSEQQEESMIEDARDKTEDEMEVEENEESEVEAEEEHEVSQQENESQVENEEQVEDEKQNEEQVEDEEVEDNEEFEEEQEDNVEEAENGVENESQNLEESQEQENEEENESGVQNESNVEDEDAGVESEEIVSENELVLEDQVEEVVEDEIDDVIGEVHDEGGENDEIEDSEEINEQQAADAETPNKSHDTTGRNRKLDKSPEAIRYNATTQDISFTTKGRNTSVRNTSINTTVKRSLVPARESNEFSYGTVDSSAEGSGWDSHRNERKTLRQTFGRDFTPRKSLRALVMEKSAKRQTVINEANLKLHQANSTEMADDDNGMDYEDNVNCEVSDHEISKRTRQTTLEMYLQKIKKQNIERKLQIEQQVRNSLKSNPVRAEFFNKAPYKSAVKTLAAPKAKRKRPTIISLEDLPSELVEDLKYKPPKKFKPSNASWITKRLYKFLETMLEPKYDYKARVRAEKLVETIYAFAHDLRRVRTANAHAVNELKKEMARLGVVRTHYEFYGFVRDYMPSEVRFKVVPDIANNIPLPRSGVFADILLPDEV